MLANVCVQFSADYLCQFGRAPCQKQGRRAYVDLDVGLAGRDLDLPARWWEGVRNAHEPGLPRPPPLRDRIPLDEKMMTVMKQKFQQADIFKEDVWTRKPYQRV